MSSGKTLYCNELLTFVTVVTGATDGIGKEYARQLAERGLNIVLVSRSLSKLEDVALEIRQSFGVKTLVIDVDFTGGPEIYDKIRSAIKGKEIGVLVNNIGIGNAAPDYFLSYPDREKFTQDLIKCNVTSIPTMCSIVMPRMVERKRGLVINLSSFLGVTCSTMAAAYGASKAFANKFSEDLADDYKDDGIIVQTLMPGFVVTNMSKFASSNIIIPSTRDYVKSALKTVGVTRYTAGYLPHALIMYVSQLIRFLSPSLSRAVTRLPMKYLLYRESKYRGYKSASVIE